MILLVHMLFGAAIAAKIQNPVLAIILAFLSHYLLDILPHTEYPIDNIKRGRLKMARPDILRVSLDFLAGILLIYIFSNRELIIFIAAFFAILPDGLSLINSFFPNKILTAYNNFHQKRLHYFKEPACRQAGKKIPNFWRILSQVTVVLISLALFFSSFF